MKLFPTVFAVDNSIDLSPAGQFAGLKDLTVGSIVSGLIRLVLIIAALAFFTILVLGGIRWILSRGDKAEVENARNQITHALIGLAVIFAAWAIIKLIETLFGINILQLTIPSLQ